MVTNIILVIAVATGIVLLLGAILVLRKKTTTTQGTIVSITTGTGNRGYKNGKPSQEWIQPYTIYVELVINGITETVSRKLDVTVPYEDRQNSFSYIPFQINQVIDVGVDAAQPYGFTICSESEKLR
jgi:hypothetical protein